MNLIAELNSEVRSNDLVVGIHLISVNNRGSLLKKCECPKQYPVLCISTAPPSQYSCVARSNFINLLTFLDPDKVTALMFLALSLS